MIPKTAFLFFLFLLFANLFLSAQQKDWMLGPFEKVDSVNPCLEPGDLRFRDPILKKW